jgi:hypothetical protein
MQIHRWISRKEAWGEEVNKGSVTAITILMLCCKRKCIGKRYDESGFKAATL